MRDALSRRVDPWQAARAGKQVSGTLDAARLPRLSSLAEPVGLLQVSLAFEPWQPAAASRGIEAVRVVVGVTGCLRSTCQRCLEPVEYPTDLSAVVTVVADEMDQAEEGPGDPERVMVAPGELLDVGALVEDEMILSLPFAPAHAEGECASRLPGADTQEEAVQAEPAERADNPFAVLGALKGRDRDDT